MLRVTATALVLLSLATPALADDGPLRWAWHKVWGDPIPKQAQEINFNVTGLPQQKPAPAPREVQTIVVDSGQAALARVEQLKLQAQELEKKKIQADMQARVTARLNEMKKVDSILFQKSLEKGLPYTFTYQGVEVRGKSLKAETSLDGAQSKCMRTLSDSIVALLGVPEYRKYLDDQKIAKIEFRLFDNRDSSRSDKMFGIGARAATEKATAGTVVRNVCVSTYGDRIGKVADDPNDCKIYSSIYGYKQVGGLKIVDKPIFVVDGLLDSNGACVDTRDELLAEMELYTHPEESKKLEVDKPAVGINESVVSTATAAKSVPGGSDRAPTLAGPGTSKPAG